MSDFWTDLPTWRENPSDTRAWIDTYILGFTAPWVRYATEDWILWAAGAWDTAVGLIMMFEPELALSWIYGFSLQWEMEPDEYTRIMANTGTVSVLMTVGGVVTILATKSVRDLIFLVLPYTLMPILSLLNGSTVTLDADEKNWMNLVWAWSALHQIVFPTFAWLWLTTFMGLKEDSLDLNELVMYGKWCLFAPYLVFYGFLSFQWLI